LRDRYRGFRRARALASSRRTGVHATYSVRRAQYDFARSAWKALLLVGGLFCVLSPLVLLLPAASRNFALGLWVASAAWLTYGFVLLGSGTALRAMGGVAEEWTASELRPLQKSGWRLINHVMIGPVDVDHVLVGPGGVIAIETKWTAGDLRPVGISKHWTLGAGVERIAESSRRLTNTLRNVSGGTTVQPMVAVWGPELRYDDWKDVVIDGVTVVHGLDIARYVARVGDRMSVSVAEAVWTRLAADVERDDQKRPAPQPPPTPIDVLFNAAGVLAGALAALAAIGFVWTRSREIAPSIAAPVAAAVVGFAARRWKPLRWATLGWFAGVAIASLLLAVGLTVTAVT
jgi:hypothetical protein